MKSINFVVLGDHHRIATELGGTKGTVNDIVIYDRKTSDTLYTWIAPITFPDKILSLIQAMLWIHLVSSSAHMTLMKRN